MKQIYAYVLCFLFLFGIACSMSSAQEEWMPDKNLQQAVRKKLEIPDNILLTPPDMHRLHDLVSINEGIESLQGLQHAMNLSFLHIAPAKVSDLAPLAGLRKLTVLKLYENNISDIKPLARLTSLQELGLEGNNISDITPLSNLTALKHLRLHYNKITDLTPLANLTNLEELSIAGNPITDFSPLAEFPHFAHLIPTVIEIPDPTFERAIREKLGLSAKVPLTDVDMQRLWDLVVLESDIANLQGLEHAVNLRFLHLSNSRIVDLTPLANLASLEVLKLYNNEISDITPLANLTKLKELNLSGNQITDYSPIEELSGVDFGYCETPRFSTIDRVKNRNYPSIFSAWHNIINLPTLSYSERLAYHDLHFCCPLFGLGFAETEQGIKLVGDLGAARNQRDAIVAKNPNMLFLVGIYYYGAHPDQHPENWPYWLRDGNGNRVQDVGWSELLIDFTIPEAQDFFVQQAVAVAECGLYDGIFFDWWSEEWNALYNRRTGERYYDLEVEVNAKVSILRRIREAVGDDFLILVNTNRSKVPRSAPYVNGTFMETLRDHEKGYTYAGLSEIESTLLWSEKNFRYPQINGLEGWGIETEPLDSLANRRWMRLFTTLSLTHSDGYVQYVSGISSTIHTHTYEIWKGHSAEHARGEIHDHQHHHYYYDFWDADLGEPIGAKAQRYENRDGLFIREFTNGWAVYNRSGKEQTIVLPSHATGVASGLRKRQHTLPDLDGEMYLKTVLQIAPGKRPPLFWIDAQTGALHRLVGDEVENLVPGVQNATSLAIDAAGGKLYWTEKTSDRTGKIQLANLDGTNVQLVKDLTSAPLNIALDTAGGKLYLSNAWGKIQRMNLNGSNFQSNLITDLKSPQNLALDIAGGRLYWTEQTGKTTGKIQRANLDGSNVQLVKTLTSAPRGMAFDKTNRKLYVTDTFGKFQRMDLDGSNFQPNFITGLVSPGKVAVDVVEGKVYWTEKGKIRYADLDGGNIRDVMSGLDQPLDIALGINATGQTRVAAAPAIRTVPEQTRLLANYPNPFNPETWIPYQLATNTNVEIHIYNTHGALVRRLELGHQLAGTYTDRGRAAYWDGRNDVGERVASGIYFYQLQADNLSFLRKMLILK